MSNVVPGWSGGCERFLRLDTDADLLAGLQADGGLGLSWRAAVHRAVFCASGQPVHAATGRFTFQASNALGKLGEIASSRSSLRPTGFIFHMSRCGSTLVSQMLAASSENIVLSEAAPIDDILRAHFRDPGVTEEQQVQWLQWLVGVLSWRRFPAEKNVFIKFDCWHVMFLPLIQRAFPDVPWIFSLSRTAGGDGICPEAVGRADDSRCFAARPVRLGFRNGRQNEPLRIYRTGAGQTLRGGAGPSPRVAKVNWSTTVNCQLQSGRR